MTRKVAMMMKILVCGLLAGALLHFDAASAATRDKLARAKAGAPPARVVCGQTGCFDVPPGCGYELRRSGRGHNVVAVVICPR